jgi:hypothetical protein
MDDSAPNSEDGKDTILVVLHLLLGFKILQPSSASMAPAKHTFNADYLLVVLFAIFAGLSR